MQTQTVFSHIVSKRLSQEYENIATDSLAFILQYSESARNGMMKLLLGIVPDMPNLRFRTQQTKQLTKRIMRPDMLGDDEHGTRVFIENKFWAGLTENQPNFYLKQLAECTQTTVLLFVVPEAREETMWGELNIRLKNEGILAVNKDVATGNIVHSIKTEIGPILALTSWTRLLYVLENEVADDPSARRDLFQLRALCDAAESNEFVPISTAVVSDQRTPAFILQLISILQTSIDKAVNEGVVNLYGTAPRANWERIGRYANVSNRRDVGFYVGIHFRLWKTYGRTPIWLVFSGSKWGRARDVWPLIEPAAEKEGIFTKFVDDEFVVAIDMVFGENKDLEVRNVVDRLNWIASVLKDLPVLKKELSPDATPEIGDSNNA